MKNPKKINLANIPTPVFKINYNGCTFHIKRDDYTGTELSGNKIRKLEYLLYEAKKLGADYVFTSGGEQSNHARATAIAAASVGIKSKLFLWGQERKNYDGNLFLDKMVGAEFVFLNLKEYQNLEKHISREKNKLERKGKKVYVIPEGGSSPTGIWGYINFVRELKEQLDGKKIKGILVAAGSGGTTAGILLGLHLYNLNFKIFAVNVLHTPEFMTGKIKNLADECNAKYKITRKIDYSRFEVIGGYSGEGYKHIAQQKVHVIRDFARQTGIILDPAYTGKAFYAFNELFLKGKKTSSVLFLHTGGLFGAFAKRKNYLGV